MPPTFNGSYIREPGDLTTVATEAEVIQAFCDGHQVTAQTFDDLEVDELETVVRVGNFLIAAAESTINAYGKKRGYLIPFSPVDSDIVDLAAQLVWIAALQRGGTLSMDDANKQRESLRTGRLEAIANGDLFLTAVTIGQESAPGTDVYRLSDAASRDPRGRVTQPTKSDLTGFR